VILVTCGSSHLPFDRLVAAAGKLAGGERLVVQHGPSPVRAAGARNVDFLPMDELTELVRQARVVVTHAGVGSILLALTNGTRPCVVPRRAHLGEAVDDHQLECAQRFARAGLVTLIGDTTDLGAAVATADTGIAARSGGELQLVSELRTYVREAIAR
jgi:UDP-N-acetylglucosamine transferase subunit ALG13